MENKVFTHVEAILNIKPRLVRCDNCNYEIVTDLPDPRCNICKSRLYNVVKSLLDERKK